MNTCSLASTSTRSTTRTGSRCRPVSGTRSPTASCSPAGSTTASTSTRGTDWNALVEARLATLDPFSKEARDLKRFFFSAASDAELDKQGRVLVPPALLRHGRLGREVVVAGVHDHLEIWDRSAWNDNVTKVEGSADDVAERLAEKRV